MYQVCDFEDAIHALQQLYEEKCDECITLEAEKAELEDEVAALEQELIELENGPDV